jgi:ferredoxin
MSALRVSVNTTKCQSYKRCAAVAPAVFGIGSDGKATVLHPDGASKEEVVKAARSCPYRAITVVAESTGEQLFPPLPRSTIPTS